MFFIRQTQISIAIVSNGLINLDDSIEKIIDFDTKDKIGTINLSST